MLKLSFIIIVIVFTLFILFYGATTASAQTIDIDVILICAEASCNDPKSDVPIFEHLCEIGTTGPDCPASALVDNVYKKADNENWWSSPPGTEPRAVVISESVDSWRTGWLNNKAIGILTLEGHNFDELKLAADGNTFVSNVRPTVMLTNFSHPIMEPFEGGIVEYTNNGIDTGYMSGWESSEGTALGLLANDTSKAGLLVFEKDDRLIGNFGDAAERRVFFGAADFGNLNPQGLKIFERALEWTGYTNENEIIIGQSIGLSKSKVLLICGNSSCNDPQKDQPIFDYLCGGYSIGFLCNGADKKVDELIKIDDTDETSFDFYSKEIPFKKKAVVISESVDSWRTGWLKDKPVGIVTLEGHNFDELGMAYNGASFLTQENKKLIINNTLTSHHEIHHYITEPFESGIIQLSTNATNTGYMFDWNSNGNEARALGVYADDHTKAAIIAVDIDEKLHDGTNATEKRVYFAGMNFGNLTDSFGKIIFDRSLRWVAGQSNTPQSVITFYPPDQPYQAGERIKVIIKDPTIPSGQTPVPTEIEFRFIGISKNLDPPPSSKTKVLEYHGNKTYAQKLDLIPENEAATNETDIPVTIGDTVFVWYDDFTGTTHTASFVIGEGGPDPSSGFPRIENWTRLTFKADCATYSDIDSDSDGICDGWESSGDIDFTINTGTRDIDYFYDCQPACGSDKKDIFLEIDYMEGHRPHSDLTELINSTFNNAPDGGARIHIQIDEEVVPHDGDFLWNGLNNDIVNFGFRQIREANFGTVEERDGYTGPSGTDWQEWKDNGFLAKKQIFHYALFVHSQQGDPLSSGVAEGNSGMPEFTGDDMLVSLGPYTKGVGSLEQQTGTLLHELGHNLALGHGGGDTINCKPNYFSVMSYARQFTTFDPNRPPDFSRSETIDLDENQPDEMQGIVSDLIDQMFVWNLNGIVMSGVADGSTPIDWDDIPGQNNPVDLNNFVGCSTPNIETLDKYDDWDNVKFNFRDNDALGYFDIDQATSGIGSISSNTNFIDRIADEITAKNVTEHRNLRIDTFDNLIQSTIQSGLSTSTSTISDSSILTEECSIITSDTSTILDNLEEQLEAIQTLSSIHWKDRENESDILIDYEDTVHDSYDQIQSQAFKDKIDIEAFEEIDNKFKDVIDSFEPKNAYYHTIQIQKLSGLINELKEFLTEYKNNCQIDTINDEYNQKISKIKAFVTGRDLIGEANKIWDIVYNKIQDDKRINEKQKRTIQEEINHIKESFEKDTKFQFTSVHKDFPTNIITIRNGTFANAQSPDDKCNQHTIHCASPFFVNLPKGETEVTWFNEDHYRYRISCNSLDEKPKNAVIPVWFYSNSSFHYQFEEGGIYNCIIKPTAPNTESITSYISIEKP